MEDNPTLTGSEFAGRYRIERELGRGGAAVVYLAHDSRQERQVALKVLHRELGQAIGAQRFLREIKHSSSLHHPHLLSIHDSGEEHGSLYFVMPYMRDGSLRARIAREKQLPIDDALRITRDVGEALAYAHSRGIVHRDIKPDNVLFSGDHACLADFGIARAMDSVSVDTLTSTGLVVGTPAYMSPEQASGEKKVDARSDQYSLACLLYEMITGLPPFIGATQQAVISQRFSQPPPSMRAHRPSVPDQVERAVKRALDISPADRFASVEEFVEALHDSTAVPQPVSVHSIRRRWFAVGAAAALVILGVMAAGPGADLVRDAWGTRPDTSKFVVLPFLSEADPEQGERVAAGLYSALSRWQGLPLERDIAVRDAIVARGGKITSRDNAIGVAKELGAGRVIWGRVTNDRGVLRVHADLYDASSKVSLIERSATTDSSFTDVALQRLANSLLVSNAVPPGEDDGIAGTESFVAWQAYVRGVAALAEWRLDTAEQELRAAVDADPAFGIAQLRFAQIQSWTLPERDDSWLVTARRALALRSELRERDALRAEALLRFGVREYDVACARYRELVQQDTLDPVAWFSLGACLRADPVVVPDRRSRSKWSFRSSWHEAGRAFTRAFEIEPKLHAIPRFGWVRQVFTIDRNRIRLGRSVERSREFAARPTLVADTIAYIPYPFPNWEQEDGPGSRERRAAALNRNNEVMLGITRSWTRTYPRSADAFRALAVVTENSDELTGSGVSGGALQALSRAKDLASTRPESLAVSESQVRVLIKLGRYRDARTLADSVIRGHGEATAANWKSIARLAGLTGRAPEYEAALQYFWEHHAGIKGLDQTVAKAGGQLLSRATLGLCGRATESSEATVRRMIQTRVRPERRDEVHRGVLSQGLSYLVFCTDGKSMAAATRDESLIGRAQIAFARGDVRTARAIIDTLDRHRSLLRAGDMAVNLAVRHAGVRLHLGDTASAARILDMTLEAIPTLSASVFGEHPLEPVMLIRAMILRADLAAATRNPVVARYWSREVLELWRGADPSLRPTLARMEELSQMRESNFR